MRTAANNLYRKGIQTINTEKTAKIYTKDILVLSITAVLVK